MMNIEQGLEDLGGIVLCYQCEIMKLHSLSYSFYFEYKHYSVVFTN
jgi:hypothetical protein